MKCDFCDIEKPDTKPVVWKGKYYPKLCMDCLQDVAGTGFVSSNAGYERRRQYEDFAQDTVQPYTATGPNKEFARLYPDAAKKIFTAAEMEQVRREI